MRRRALWKTCQSKPELMPITPVVASTPVSKSNLIQARLGLGVDFKLIRKRNPVILKSTPTQLGVLGVVSIGFSVFCPRVGVDFRVTSVSIFCKHRPKSITTPDAISVPDKLVLNPLETYFGQIGNFLHHRKNDFCRTIWNKHAYCILSEMRERIIHVTCTSTRYIVLVHCTEIAKITLLYCVWGKVLASS
jgi:hypothetical protein